MPWGGLTDGLVPCPATGSIPTRLSLLSGLEILNLSDNTLTGAEAFRDSNGAAVPVTFRERSW